MTTNSQLLTTEPKNKNRNKLSKQQQEQIHRNGDHMEGLSVGIGSGENEGKGTRNKKHIWQVQNRQGEFNNSIGNGEVKELIYIYI